MPKHEAFTPKAIGKKIKSKGLQKLKWYCQMCQKQCRDENGFKCHSTSESHQRQLLLFAENPHKYMDAFSGEFLKDFLNLIKRRFSTKRVHANQVYQEYIKDRNHLHMNATRWVTLTGLVKWLGRKGLCHVDHTEKGWFITYIDRDPETLQKQENLAKKQKLDRDYEERMAKIIEEQVERGKQQEKGYNKPDDKDQEKEKPAEFIRENEEQKITFALVSSSTDKDHTEDQVSSSTIPRNKPIPVNPLKLATKSISDTASVASSYKRKKNDETKKSALDEIIEEQERFKAKKLKNQDYWLLPGIVVKLITKSLGEKYYKQKGVVEQVENKYCGIVRLLGDSNDLIKIDQEHVETVIPQIGRPVIVVKGVHRSCEATLLEVDFDHFCTKIRLESGPLKGRILDSVKYEDISKKH